MPTQKVGLSRVMFDSGGHSFCIRTQSSGFVHPHLWRSSSLYTGKSRDNPSERPPLRLVIPALGEVLSSDGIRISSQRAARCMPPIFSGVVGRPMSRRNQPCFRTPGRV